MTVSTNDLRAQSVHVPKASPAARIITGLPYISIYGAPLAAITEGDVEIAIGAKGDLTTIVI